MLEVGGKPTNREVYRAYMYGKKEGDTVSFKVKRAGTVIDVIGKAPVPPKS